MKKKFKMIIPRFGTFTNGPYKVKGVMFLGKLYGKVLESYYPMVHDIGSFVVMSEYRLPDDEDPVFYRLY
jgi:hypothetical protein